MTADLSALIARLEAAEVGSREMDDAVWFAATGEKASYPFEDETDPHIRYGALAWVRLPRSTTSLDAALALAERVLPKDTFWEMSHNAVINVQCMYHADVFPPYQSGEATFWGYGPHPALALCIAILRAKQGEKE